jgi:general secretion pathway protein N
MRSAAAESLTNMFDPSATEAKNAIVAAGSDVKTDIVSTPASGAEPKGRQGNPLWDIPLASLTSTRERPIFSRSRRPSHLIAVPLPAQASPVAVKESKPPLTLVGAISAGKDGIGIFVDSKTQAVFRLKTGESHSGWILLTVTGREAKLHKQDQTATLVIPISTAK